MVSKDRCDQIARGIVERRLVRVRVAPGVRPLDGAKAYFVQGGLQAGMITTERGGSCVGVLDGSELWGWAYPFAFLYPIGGKVDFACREITVTEACKMIGVRPPTFVARCSRSVAKAWPIIGGIYRQCTIANPYSHVHAYRVDPRGRWHVTLFERSHIFGPTRFHPPRDGEQADQEARELASELLDDAAGGGGRRAPA